MKKSSTLTLCMVLTGLSLVGQVQNEEAPLYDLGGFDIIGSKEAVELLPGSASFVDAAELRQHGYDDINQTLRTIPGVYTRQEDGYGLFPNISFRGVSSMRSSKVTVMEDGVLTAPAPYSAPAAYYSPTVGRMSALEVLKGSSQIRFGPHTTGGVINYVSTPVPGRREGRALLSYGSDNDVRAHLWFGDSLTLDSGGSFGYLVENYYRSVDGFKTLDGTAATNPSDETGFENNDSNLKLRFVTADRRHSLEAKVGYNNLDADETYLGLTDADFRADPYRRYAASRFDNIDTRQFRSYLRHHFEISPEVALNTTFYLNKFDRAWYKLNDARAAGDGSWRNPSEILAGGHGQEAIDVLRGEAMGQLRVRNNNRSYEAKGIQSSLRFLLDQAETTHEFDFGFRLHEDSETRFQNDDVYNQNDLGGIDDVNFGAPGTQDNRTGEAQATAFYFMDRISAGLWTVTPGLRYENVHYTNTRRSTTPGEDFNEVLAGFPTSRTVEAWTPGVGFTYAGGNPLSFFGGVHRGVSMPGPGDATGGSMLEEETSLGFELGARFQSAEKAAWGEITGFLTDFDDLIVPSNIGGGGGSFTTNIGEVRTWGLEALFGWDPARAAGNDYRLPMTLSFTWTEATLRNDVNSDGGSGGAVESVFAGGRSGNDVPYIPGYQISFTTGYENGPFGAYLNAFYVDSVYGTANNTDSLRRGENADGPLDSRFGKSDGYFLLDLSLLYHLSEVDSLKFNAENLLDREYLASRLPHGPRPGKPFTVSVGYSRLF